LDLCYVACGRYDGFWELNLSAWDTAAGTLIVEEAGGRVSNFSNDKFSNYAPEIVASNGLIHDRMIEVIAMAGKKR
jgi:myo-inositol-1(or 4)-monophosphatase